MVKKILSIVSWVLTGAALALLFAFGRTHYLETPLQGISLQIEREYPNGFVVKDTVLRQFEVICDIKHHARISKIDMLKIQKKLQTNPWIETSSAYIGLNDSLMVRAKEYEPVLRVYNQDGKSVYVTKDGVIFPACPNHTPRTIIASGHYNFPEPNKGDRACDSVYRGSGIQETLVITEAIQNDDFLAGTIGQIYKNTNNEYELMVNNLQARVILGDTLAVDSKLSRLKTLLESYSGTEELAGYKAVNLKYKNQIVCTKL